ncbi:MAG: sugar transferase [Bacteroidota bacterium]|nr:sugar transferase [Bacteroidota bacterium]MDP4212991.1 sugar transferase [Bacteroidota bacterium]MDP4249979.1 sugar transferase [Bacteroidota bacterium]
MEKLESMNGFYYIGTNQANIEKLVKIYKRGYAADNLQDTFRELTRENFFLPDVICCESRFGLSAVKHFARQLANHAALSRIPFIMDADGMSIEDRSYYIRNELVDDILFISACDEKRLYSKINFLNKFKFRTFEPGREKKEVFSGNTRASLHDFLKRCFDILLASTALVILAPLFVLIAILVKADSPGPVFYISKRAGKGYRIFNFYKFRTMFEGADRRLGELAHLNQYRDVPETLFVKIDDDPRCTRLGLFLRRTSLDELPQLINVLLGDMSLVGNRPLPLYEAANLTTDDLATRFLAPAGITGLWQIKKRGGKEMSVQERIILDNDYASKYNFMYDLWIMANTPQALLQKVNS